MSTEEHKKKGDIKVEDINKEEKKCCVNIKKKFEKPTEYDEDFKSFCKKYKIKLSRLSSMKGMVIAILTNKENRNKYVNRDILEKIMKDLEKYSKDVIQLINKTDQWGLVYETDSSKKKHDVHYRIPYPFRYTSVHVEKRKDFTGHFQDKDARNKAINAQKEHIKNYYIDVPNDKWELGHKDANKKDNTDKNLIIQPPIQGKYKDKFIFFDALTRMPSGKELSKDIKSKKHKYYGEDDLKLIYKSLKKRFE